ncbi:helix-turn-helix domain-containing protein [Acetobacter cerevisiae]|uniref:Helix-turn-helix domain-containing protein n=1 Tax=Acetobacter cerevisiae TaxID=178900 RepID=A0ABT1EUX3_9PROT|nr:helix-turn-helix domain-containing protein [Acetobacter cerevisiae]MCP1247172.1 helix-turn-helix domain-containing protein [Acetobacter cerevisiae]MCP1256778.1 helix-turn-helix domain-containing protein [Acetobacter cerevisiae]
MPRLFERLLVVTSFASTLWTLTQSRTITAKTHLVLQALASFQGYRGLFPSHESIASRSGCSVRTVIRALEAAYRLGIVTRTRQRQRVSGRVCNGVNRYRLIIKPLEQARAAAVHYTQQLREALSRRKQAFLSKCQNDSEPHIQSNFFNTEPLSGAGMSHNDLIRWCESIGYRGST